MSRWCVVFEERDDFGNQGIGTDIITAPDLIGAYKKVDKELQDLLKNSVPIVSARIIGVNIMPDIQKEV